MLGALQSGAHGLGRLLRLPVGGRQDSAIAIGDVAGKGISAALLMATIQAALRMELRACARTWPASMNGTRFSTARMVSELNQQLHATTSPEKYATFFFARFQVSFFFSSAFLRIFFSA